MKDYVENWNWGMIILLVGGLMIAGLMSLVQLIYQYHAVGYVLLAITALIVGPYWVGKLAK